MSRYIRHSPVINRQSDEPIGEDHWLKQFQKTLQKGAVQPRTQESLFDQINSVMNGSRSKHTSVEAAVQEMQERSGLTAYLDKIKVSEREDAIKTTTASDQQQAIDKSIPSVIVKCPAIQKTLENYITDTKGNLPIPAIIDKIRSIHQGDVSEAKDWDDDKLLKLVSSLNLKAKKNNPEVYNQDFNLGKRDFMGDSDIDASNTDVFNILMPASK